MTRYRWIAVVTSLFLALGISLVVFWPSNAEPSTSTVLAVAPAAPPPLPAAVVANAAVLSLAGDSPVEEAAVTFALVWVAPFGATELWVGPEADALQLEALRGGVPLQVLAPQAGPRLQVLNPLTSNQGWVNASAVAPTVEPTEQELADLRNPPPFQPYWAVTQRPAIAWSSPEADAAPFNRIPRGRYLNVVLPAEGQRTYVFDWRSEAYAYVDLAALAGATRPDDDYFASDAALADESLALPGRVVGPLAGHAYFQPVTVDEVVERRGFRIGSDVYAPVNSVRVPSLPQRVFPGRWIDANLSEPVLVTAYDGEQPIYSAVAIKGIAPTLTPTGVFRILHRVANETMDSATIGIPRASAGGYYLRNVLYTQYFTGDGAALHYNYWRVNWGYGGSHGCLGLNFDDSKFLWDFATVGTPVYIHF